MKRALICGYLGFNNLGDELLLKSTLEDLNQLEIGCIVLSANPLLTSESFKVEAKNRWNLLDILISIWRCEILVFIGGLFQDLTSSISLYYYLSLILVGKFFRKKIVLYGIEIGHIGKKINRKIALAIFKMTDYILVRNKSSLDFLINGGVKRCHLTADLLFSEKHTQVTIPANIKKIGLCLKRVSPTAALKLSKTLLSAFDNPEIFFIPFHLDSDFKLAVKMFDFWRYPTTIVIWKNVSDIYNIMKRMDLVISQRFHGLILGLLMNKISIGLDEPSGKIASLLDEFELECFSIEKLNEEKISNYISGFLKNKGKIDKKLKEIIKRKKLNISYLRKLI